MRFKDDVAVLMGHSKSVFFESLDATLTTIDGLNISAIILKM